MSLKPITKIAVGMLILLAALYVCYQVVTHSSLGSDLQPGTPIDELNGVVIFYNGGVNETYGRNLTADGYNLGIRYQCVEFVKRYYFERFGHRMPDAYGHAKSFFDPALADGALNTMRGLTQFSNGSSTAPVAEDIIVFSPSLLNPYGHIAVIAEVNAYAVIIAQQNAGPILSSREALVLTQSDGHYRIQDARVLGWLRLPSSASTSAAAGSAPLNGEEHP